jgi:dGTPase
LNITAEQWADLTTFEGNANAFRILTHQFEGRREGGFVLTYPTLASIVKYPYESRFADKKKQKFGFFQSEVKSYERIAEDLGIIRNPFNADRYARYPLVYLVEAADDICYQMMDIEDAYKLRLLTYTETKDLLMRYLPLRRRERAENEVFKMVSDENEQISYLRSSVVGTLIDGVSKVFIDNEEAILNGEFQGALIDHLPEELREAYKHSSKVSVKKIYRAQMVLDIELAGYKIISELLDVLMAAVFEPEKAYSKQFLSRIPQQYNVSAESDYEKVQSILDYISGMTDVYALDLYRKINGMSLPTI